MIIIGVALAAFVLGDFINPRKYSRKSMVNIGVVDGVDIPSIEFNKKVEDDMEMRRQNSGNQSLTPSESYSVRQSVWQEMVSNIILGDQYHQLGVVVSVDELDDQIRGNEPHEYIVQNFKDPQTGKFNPATVTRFLQNFNNLEPEMQKRYLMLESMIKTDRLHTKYNDLISQGYYTPDLLAKDDYLDKNKKAKIRLVGIKYATIPDSTVTASNEDYKAYYDKHKQDYEQDAAVDIDYVTFPLTPSPEDRQKLAESVEQIYQQFKTASDVPDFVNAVSDTRYDSTWHKQGTLPVQIDSVMFNSPVGTFYGSYIENDVYHIAKLVDVQMRPDSMRASNILISYQGARGAQQITRTKEEAKKLADSIYTALIVRPAEYNDMVLKYSDDPTARKNMGDLDWFPDGKMIYQFNEACLEGKVGDIVMTETPFGYHVIKITGKQPLQKKVRVAMIDRSIQPSNETDQATYLKANEFVSKYNTLSAFEKGVLDQGQDKRTADKVGPLSNNIPGVNDPRQIIRWAFNNKTKKGDVSQVFDMGDAYVVATVKETYKKGLAQLSEVRERIKPLVLREKKAGIAQPFNASVDTLSDITFGSYNMPLFGPEMEVIGVIFSMKPGEVSKPLQGNQAVYVIA
jgi:peptidyl-prolyl cis-trans isomerase D